MKKFPSARALVDSVFIDNEIIFIFLFLSIMQRLLLKRARASDTHVSPCTHSARIRAYTPGTAGSAQMCVTRVA